MDEHTQLRADGFQPHGAILICIRDPYGPRHSVVVLHPDGSLVLNGTPEGLAEIQHHWPRWQKLARRLTRRLSA